MTSVSIGLERVVAKVELTQTQETFPLTDPSGKTYCTIKLNNFRMLNLATQFYTFRHTAVLNSFQEPDSYTDENFGDINDNNGYVIDPYFFKKQWRTPGTLQTPTVSLHSSSTVGYQRRQLGRHGSS